MSYSGKRSLRTEGRTNGKTEQLTHGRRDGQTQRLILEMLSAVLNASKSKVLGHFTVEYTTFTSDIEHILV